MFRQALAVVAVAFVLECAPTREDAENNSNLESVIQPIGSPVIWPIEGVSPNICWHRAGSGAHRPGGGIGSADETYALDLNCQSNLEYHKAVHPVRPGIVRATSAGDTTHTSYVLVEHLEPLTVDGVSYSSYFTAYLHMSEITIGNDTAVTTTTTLGQVSYYGLSDKDLTHLHLVAYVGEWSTDSRSNWSRLRSFNPSILGSDFTVYDYTPYIYRAWVDNSKSTGSYVFTTNGTSSDIFTDSSHGVFGSMMYTTTKAASPDDNWFEFKWNGGVPATHQYYVWAYIPSTHTTTTHATYRILAGTTEASSGQSEVDSVEISQQARRNNYYRRHKSTINAGSYVTLKVGDYTKETGAELGADYAILWWKADHCLGLGCTSLATTKYYCLQSHYETAGVSSQCPPTDSDSLPLGF